MKCRFSLLVFLAWFVQMAGLSTGVARGEEDAHLSVTVYPVVTSPQSLDDELARRAGTVVATLLERSGVHELKVADTRFSPPEAGDVEQIAAAFGRLVASERIGTDYAVFAQFVGSPRTGIEAIHTAVVDRAGKVVLAESAGESQFAQAPLRPKDPMSCCIFVSRRLQQLWDLKDPLRPDAPEGKMAEFWREDAGIPAQEELDAIARRAESLKKNIKSASCMIYPIRVGQGPQDACAEKLAAMLNEAQLCHADTCETNPALQITPHSNEQKVLWDTAKAFQRFVREQPPEADYAVYADYGLFGDKVRYVHVIVCDRSGEWVLIDMQNSHHTLFQQIAPKSCADCNRMLIARLREWLGV